MDNHLTVHATGLYLKGLDGNAYGPLDLSIPDRGLTVLHRPSGGGNTALALTLAGRMKPSGGSLTVLGESSPYKIRRFVGIAGTKEIDPLDRDLRLRTVIGEYRNWNRHWWQPMATATKDYYEQLLTPVFGNHPLPNLHDYVSTCSDLDQLLIRIAMSLANKGNRMLVVDDIEQVRSRAEREILLERLDVLSQGRPIIAFAINSTHTPREVQL